MAKLLSGKEVTASLNEEIRKKTELLTAHHITPKQQLADSHQNSASSALVKEKMIFLTSAVRLNAVKLLAFPMKNSCFRKMPQRKWF